jgi:hypothetical protein
MSWEFLREGINMAKVPVAFALDGEPAMHLFFEPGTGRLGLRMPTGVGDLPASLLAQLRVSRKSVNGSDVLEVSSTAVSLRPYLHAFTVAVADRVQYEGWDPADAVTESLAKFEALLQHLTFLSPEIQLGLLGELWLLERLIGIHGGANALAAWTGPKQQAHDARVGDVEIEVKATRGEHRIHMISSATQLVASEGCSLYLLSLQLTLAGAQAGLSLLDRVQRVQALLGSGVVRREFDDLLFQAHGLSEDELGRYRTQYKLRSKPYLVSVDEGFPRVTPDALAGVIDISRVSDIRYRVNVEALGFEDKSEAFLAVLPKE